MTYKEFADEYDVDFKDVVRLRLAGMRWKEIFAQNPDAIKKHTEDWCRDNGQDFSELRNCGRWNNAVITVTRMVDSGRVHALHKAGWSVQAIAVDCHCAVACVEEILDGGD
mgnify:CR=1 FL=1